MRREKYNNLPGRSPNDGNHMILQDLVECSESEGLRFVALHGTAGDTRNGTKGEGMALSDTHVSAAGDAVPKTILCVGLGGLSNGHERCSGNNMIKGPSNPGSARLETDGCDGGNGAGKDGMGHRWSRCAGCSLVGRDCGESGVDEKC